MKINYVDLDNVVYKLSKLDYKFISEQSRENGKKVIRKIKVLYNFDNLLISNYVQIDKITYTKNKEVLTTRYFRTNLNLSAQEYNKIILNHWMIETYHGHLDRNFREDKYKNIKNVKLINILNSISINIYQMFIEINARQKIKHIFDKIKRDTKFLIKILSSFVI